MERTNVNVKRKKRKKSKAQTQKQTQSQNVNIFLQEKKKSSKQKSRQKATPMPSSQNTDFARVLAPQVVYPTSLFQQQQSDIVKREIPIRNEFIPAPQAPAPLTKEQVERGRELIKQQKIAEAKLKQDIQTAETLLPYKKKESKLAPASPAEISLIDRQKKAFIKSQEQEATKQAVSDEPLFMLRRDVKTKKIKEVVPIAQAVVEQKELGLADIVDDPMTFA